MNSVFTIYLTFHSQTFQIIPSDRKLYADDTYDHENDGIKSSQCFVQTVLQEDFTPPITVVPTRKYNRVLKIETRSVVEHLQAMWAAL